MPRHTKDNDPDLGSLMADIPLFSGLTDDDLRLIKENAVVRTFPKGTVLIFEGDLTTALYVVLKGRAKAVSIDEEGRQIIHNEFKAGDIFGEMSFLDGKPRCATVLTSTIATVAIFERKNVEKLLCNRPQLTLRIIQGLLKKLRDATRKVEELVFMDAFGRVTQLLTQLAGPRKSIGIRLTHQDIAERVGASREMISRILRELVKSGYISRRDKIITLKKDLPPSL